MQQQTSRQLLPLQQVAENPSQPAPIRAKEEDGIASPIIIINRFAQEQAHVSERDIRIPRVKREAEEARRKARFLFD